MTDMLYKTEIITGEVDKYDYWEEAQEGNMQHVVSSYTKTSQIIIGVIIIILITMMIMIVVISIIVIIPIDSIIIILILVIIITIIPCNDDDNDDDDDDDDDDYWGVALFAMAAPICWMGAAHAAAFDKISWPLLPPLPHVTTRALLGIWDDGMGDADVEKTREGM